MDELIKISVIVPVYGVEKYIGKCVRSLMTQTLDGIEYIFVDDCTPDSSVAIANEIIAQYPQRARQVKWVHHPQNKGLPAARNSGLALAAGEYIYHCDSDDYLHPHMLEKLYTKARNEHLDFVWCDFFKETPSGIFIEKTAVSYNCKIEMLKEYLTYGWNVVWNTICRKDIYTKNGIKSLETISFCEDFELMARLLMCCESWGKVNEPLYYYNRTNNRSIIRNSLSSQKLMRTIENGITAVSSVCNFIEMNHTEAYGKLKKELNWRMLKAKTYLFFYPSKRQYYLSIMPESNRDIASNPLCSNFQKHMQRLILSPLGFPIVWLCGIIFKLKTTLK